MPLLYSRGHRWTVRLLDKGDQRVADLMGEGAGASRGKCQDLKAMGKWAFVAAFVAILDIIMDRMIVGGDRLERGEVRLGDGAARDIKPLANREILEPARLGNTV